MSDHNKANDQHLWPDRLMIRDTKLHDDMGGLGQRIYTTAGQGYEKQAYVHADVLREAVALIKSWHNMGMGEAGDDLWAIYWKNAPELKRIREALPALKEVK